MKTLIRLLLILSLLCATGARRWVPAITSGGGLSYYTELTQGNDSESNSFIGNSGNVTLSSSFVANSGIAANGIKRMTVRFRKSAGTANAGTISLIVLADDGFGAPNSIGLFLSSLSDTALDQTTITTSYADYIFEWSASVIGFVNGTTYHVVAVPTTDIGVNINWAGNPSGTGAQYRGNNYTTGTTWNLSQSSMDGTLVIESYH